VTPEEVLGVAADAGPEEIRAAYRAAVRAHHPDRFATAPEEVQRFHARRLREATEAWQALQARSSSSSARGGRAGDDLGADADDGAASVDASASFDDPFDPFDPFGDRPYRPAGRRSRLPLLPMAVFAAAVLTFVASVLFGSTALWLGAVGLLALSALLFVLVPFVVMVRGR